MRVWRGIARRPVATTVIVLTLGIGLGAVAVIGALLGSVLFPHVPYRDPQNLVVLWSSVRPGATERADYLMPKRADAWLAAPPLSLDGVAAVGPAPGVLRGPDATHRIQIAVVSTSFFSTLGVSAARRRLLAPIDSVAQPAVVLSDRAWRRYIQSDRRVLGQSIAVDSGFYTVVGIAPAELDYLAFRMTS